MALKSSIYFFKLTHLKSGYSSAHSLRNEYFDSQSVWLKWAFLALNIMVELEYDQRSD